MPGGGIEAAARPRLVLTSTFPVYPRVSGGQQRTFYICKSLGLRFDVEIVSLTASHEPKRQLALAPGLVETVVPKSIDHEAEEARRGAEMPFPVSDILSTVLIERSPAYLQSLRDAASGAAGAILEHPYLFPALEALESPLPYFYDAQNVEFALKAESLPGTPAGNELTDIVRKVEGSVLAGARLVFFCTEEDRTTLVREFAVSGDKFVPTPNGVDTSEIPFIDAATRREARESWFRRFRALGGAENVRHTGLFVASLHGPNIDAADRLMSLAQQMPDVIFLIAGSICEYYRRWRIPPNIALLGIITGATKATLLKVADVGLNPMVLGSGSNLKMLDYLASGLPVVTTLHGARGLDLGGGVASVRVTSIEDFPHAVRELLEHPAAAADTIAARRIVEREYDWAAIGGRVADAVAGALDLRPVPA